MADCRNIVSRALRKLGRLGAGREPRTADAEDALEALKGLYKSWVASGAFGRLADVVPTTDYTAGENQRIFRNSDAVTEITLPELVPAYAEPLPYDRERDTYAGLYEGVDGVNRPPRDGAVVVIVNSDDGLASTYIYDGAVRAWQAVDGLTLDDEAPRSYADPEGLAACVAAEVADLFGGEIAPTTFAAAVRYRHNLVSRYSGPRETVPGVFA